MKAMVLAAGLGTRLRPLTNDRPKALVEVGGRTLLEITLSRLRTSGIREVIINVHHFAQMVLDYLGANDNFGLHVEISHEEILLDTGGALKKASYFFLDRKESQEAFILHNVDVVSTIDLQDMVQYHVENQALATLAVQDRKASRYLLFDGELQLCGRKSGCGEAVELVRPAGSVQALGFSGIQVISPRMLGMITEVGAFSIIASYLRLSAEQKRIIGYRADQYYWRDIGKPESVTQAALDLERGLFL